MLAKYFSTAGTAGVLFVCIVSAPRTADAQKPETLTATQILDRMAKTYAECKSYCDSGNVKTVFAQADGNRTDVKPFTTAFVRPDRFRFEYSEKQIIGSESHYIIWRKGELVQTWWDVQPGVQKPVSLDMAIAGATGVSSGSAHTIPVLLLPQETKGRRLTSLTDAKRTGDTKLGQKDCFCIKGKFARQPMTLWIDKQSFLVLRIDERYMIDNSVVEETTTYNPVIDAKVDEKQLEFHSPAHR